MGNRCRSCRASGLASYVWRYGARMLALGCFALLLVTAPSVCADTPKLAEKDGSTPKAPEKDPDHELIQLLLVQIEMLKARVADLEAKQPGNPPASDSLPASPIPPPNFTATPVAPAAPTPEPAPRVVSKPGTPSPTPSAGLPSPEQDEGGHSMQIPGGPKLVIRGFLDFNLGFGSVANALIYPLAVPPATVHNTFQFGEFDLFLSSRLSDTVSFLSEVIYGSDQTNDWGLDIERAQLTYKPSPYFQISGGRMHTAIGFYNTTYHHGTWFQTATGRPYMYYFEDSGGILPVHIVGAEAQGLIPGSGKLNAHWIAEVGNGESSLPFGSSLGNPVQNFLSDKNHKAFNVAGYFKPEWVHGLQIGVNYYRDRRVPEGIPHVDNTIAGAYLVYITPTWEFLNEFQVQRDHSLGSAITYNTPLGYTQLSRKFGKYRPYLRWQEVNVPLNDPLYGVVGRYEGPSFGMRMDFTDFAALKVQYNRVYTRDPLAKNGVDGQVAFTF